MIKVGSKVRHTCGEWIGTILEMIGDNAGDPIYRVDKKGTVVIATEKNLAILTPPKPVVMEWTDPVTGEEHTCPEHYLTGLQTHIGTGKANAKLASILLELMGEPNNESNKRHIRAAAMYLKNTGIPVIGLRSGKGGYFIAGTKSEVDDYVSSQLIVAQSMIARANALALSFGA